MPVPEETPSTSRTVGKASVVDVSMPAPAFSVQALDGSRLDQSTFKGRITLVNFWATWCGPCIIETPELVGLQAEWSERPFRILGVSLDTYADDEVHQFVEDMEVQYPVFIDTVGLADDFGGAYALPTTYLVDDRGVIRTRYVGLFPLSDVRGTLDSLVTELEQRLPQE